MANKFHGTGHRKLAIKSSHCNAQALLMHFCPFLYISLPYLHKSQQKSTHWPTLLMQEQCFLR